MVSTVETNGTGCSSNNVYEQNMNQESFLPIGSVVILGGGSVPVMIYGRKQAAIVDGKEWGEAVGI